MVAIHAFRMRLLKPQLKTGAALGAGAILLLLFFTQGVFFIRANSQTYDEAMHLTAGYSYLVRRDFRLSPEHPPLIKELQALPLFLGYRLPFNPDPQHWREKEDYPVGHHFLYKSTLPADRMLALSRLPNLFLGGSLVALIGWWAYRLWGNHAALLAIALACLEPNLVAHSSLVTTDLGVTLFIFLTVHLLWEYVNLPRWGLLAAAGVSTGLALVSKFSALLLIPTIALIVAVSVFVSSPSRKESKPTKAQTSPCRSGPFAHTFFCLTDDSASLLFSRISALALRLAAVSELGATWPGCFFLRRVFLRRLVELFPRSLSHQNSYWNPYLNFCFSCSLQGREASREA